MKRFLTWTIIVFFCFIAVTIFYHMRTTGAMGTGSHVAANKWKSLLSSCSSPNDVNQLFNCGFYMVDPNGIPRCEVRVNVHDESIPKACIFKFVNGDWLAVAYEGSHRDDDIGGTVVTLDSNGNQKVFFGHVCGGPASAGKTIEEIYSSYKRNWKEIDLDKIDRVREPPRGGSPPTPPSMRARTRRFG